MPIKEWSVKKYRRATDSLKELKHGDQLINDDGDGHRGTAGDSKATELAISLDSTR